MEYYDFVILKGDEIIETTKCVALRNSRAAWPRIAELARNVDVPGCRIRVTDQFGRIVIFIGVAAVRAHETAPASNVA
jgi:hypothetical protein